MNETKKDYEEPTEEQLDEAAKQAKELRDLFSQVSGPGYTATLWRVSPTWCEGFLEDFDIEPQTGFDLGYICQKWGGRILNVKLKDSSGKFRKSATLKLKSWVPRHFGKIISQFDDFGDDLPQGNAPGRNIRYKQQQRYPIQQQQQPTFDPNKLMEQMFNMFRDMSKTMQMQQPDRGLLDGPATVPPDPMSQLMVSLKAFREMQKIFGTGEQLIQQADANANSDESNLFGPITQILGMMMNRQQPALPQTQHASSMLPDSVTIRNDLQGLEPRPQAQRAPDLPGLIASLDPAQIGDIIVAAASRMDQAKREHAFEVVAARLAGLESVEYEEDDLAEEDDLGEDDLTDASSNTTTKRDTD